MLLASIALVFLLMIPCPDAIVFVLAAFAIVIGLSNFAALLISKSITKPSASDSNLKLKMIARWNTRGIRITLLAVGFTGSLLISLLGLNWKTCTGSLAVEMLIPATFAEVNDDEEVVLTFRKEKKPPPPIEIFTHEIITTKEIVKEILIKEVVKEILVTDIVIPVEPPEEFNEKEIFVIVEEMPSFGNKPDDLFVYLSKCIIYPRKALQVGISGTVYIEFVVDEKGNVTNPILKRGIGGGCDEEALRCVSQMAQWKAGRQLGKPVKVRFTIPVKFKMY